MSGEKSSKLKEILNKHGLGVDRYSTTARTDYNELKAAKMVKDLRDNGFTVEIDRSIKAPIPDELKEAKGDERFDVLLDVDRSDFKVKVDGYKAQEFLTRLDDQTKANMVQDDKLAYLKEHPQAKVEIQAYKDQLKLEGKKLENKVDAYILKELSHYLPADKYWHFVNKKEQTIPIGFVYHYALDFDDYNIKIVDNRPLYIDERTPVTAVYDSDFQLRDYQEQAVESAIEKKGGIVAAATGSGKTEIGAFIVAGQGLDTVWFAHRKELIRQAEERMEKRLGVNVGAYGSGRQELVNTSGMDVNVMTVQTASNIMRVPRSEHEALVKKEKAKVRRVERLISKTNDSQKKLQLQKEKERNEVSYRQAKMKLEVYDYLQSATVQVFDESHHMTALQFGDIARATPQARYRYGLSATPYGNTSTDQKRIEALMGDKVASITATKLINEGYLAKPNILVVDIPNTIDSQFPLLKRDEKGNVVKEINEEKDMNYHDVNKFAVVKNDEFNDYVVDITLESRKAGLNTLVLVNEVEHGNLIQKKLSEKGLEVDHLNAKENPPSDNDIMLNRLREGKTDTMVATIGTVGEGVDIPALDTVVLAHGGKSLVQTIQRVGRCMRIPRGSDKKECVVIDFDRKEKFIGSGSSSNHLKKRKEIYSLEPAFEVKPVDLDEVDDEIRRIARINKAKSRKKGFSNRGYEDEEFLLREQRRERKQILKDADRLQRIGTLEKTRSGRRLNVSQEAKNVTKRHPNISPVYAQQIINIVNAQGRDSQTIRWDHIDDSLEPAEAIKDARVI